MAKVFGNIDQQLLPALRTALGLAERADFYKAKITDYLFSLSHPDGRDKAITVDRKISMRTCLFARRLLD